MKKGFTLIELLAVIMILAIISLIATPMILNVIEESRKSTAQSEANILLNTINNYCEQEKLKEQADNKYINKCLDGMDIKEIEDIINLGKIDKNSIQISFENGKLKGLYLTSGNTNFELTNGVMEEVKPLVSVSFNDDSWKTISRVAKNGLAKEKYAIGDTKNITLKGSVNGKFKVRIVNIDNPNECKNVDFSETVCGLVIEFVDVVDLKKMHFEDNNTTSFPNTDLNKYLNNEFYLSLPADLQEVISKTRIISPTSNYDIPTITSEDKIYLFSSPEICGSNAASDVENITNINGKPFTRQLEFYQNKDTSVAIKKYQNTNKLWWMRSADMNFMENYLVIDDNGVCDSLTDLATSENGVVPAFRIG